MPNWEFVGKQEMHEQRKPGKGHTYLISMWRTPVPGGWMVMTINSRSSDPQPMVNFYPDADHVWIGNAPSESNFLLRPASGGAIAGSDELLRASEVIDETKLLEE